MDTTQARALYHVRCQDMNLMLGNNLLFQDLLHPLLINIGLSLFISIQGCPDMILHTMTDKLHSTISKPWAIMELFPQLQGVHGDLRLTGLRTWNKDFVVDMLNVCDSEKRGNNRSLCMTLECQPLEINKEGGLAISFNRTRQKWRLCNRGIERNVKEDK
jgi:hypothetical protein